MKNVHLLPTDNYKQDYTLQSGEVVEVVKLKQLIVNKETGELSVNKNPQWSASCDTDVLVPHNIYITNDEEIKEGDWFIANNGVHKCIRVDNNTSCPFITLNSKKEEIGHFKTWRTRIILTTDKNLIKDGVQAIDDEFLEWFVKNQSCERVKVVDDVECMPMPNIHINKHIYRIIIPKEEPKQETLEEAAEKFRSENPGTIHWIKGSKSAMNKRDLLRYGL